MKTNQKTNQEAFDHVWNALNKQGKPCADKSGCWYRKPDGTRCSAGHLIKPEDDIVPDQGPIATSIIDSLGGNPFDCEDVGFLRDLQVAHDHCVSRIAHVSSQTWLAAWRRAMRELASRYGLKVPGDHEN